MGYRTKNDLSYGVATIDLETVNLAADLAEQMLASKIEKAAQEIHRHGYPRRGKRANFEAQQIRRLAWSLERVTELTATLVGTESRRELVIVNHNPIEEEPTWTPSE